MGWHRRNTDKTRSSGHQQRPRRGEVEPIEMPEPQATQSGPRAGFWFAQGSYEHRVEDGVGFTGESRPRQS